MAELTVERPPATYFLTLTEDEAHAVFTVLTSDDSAPYGVRRNNQPVYDVIDLLEEFREKDE